MAAMKIVHFAALARRFAIKADEPSALTGRAGKEAPSCFGAIRQEAVLRGTGGRVGEGLAMGRV
jgi:hypothetical protein